MNKYRWFICLTLLVIASFACSLVNKSLSTGGNGASGSGSNGSPTASSNGVGATGNNAKFPLPNNVINFTDTGNGSVNFQTSMSLKDTIKFYRDALTKAGDTERTVNTAITDTTFSLVFDGDPGGKSIVVQGVDLGNGKTNVNIRYEKL